METVRSSRRLQLGFWALVLVCTLGLSACSSLVDRIVPDPPEVTLVGVDLVEASLLQQTFNLTLNLQNPNDRPLAIQDTQFSAIINGEEFASGISKTPIDLPAYGESDVAVRVNSGLLKVLENLGRLSSGQGLNYRLEGSVKVDGIPVRIPFSQQGTLTP
ncbi:MAG: LEA type 2 family protein [Pseudomonadota bacterium]